MTRPSDRSARAQAAATPTPHPPEHSQAPHVGPIGSAGGVAPNSPIPNEFVGPGGEDTRAVRGTGQAESEGGLGSIENLRAADELARRRWAEKVRHNGLCPALRREECTCAANLKTHEVVLRDPAAVRVGTLVQVHPGGVETVEVSDERQGGRRYKRPIMRPPRWVCAECGWACRGHDVGHKCVPGEAMVAQAREPLHFRVDVEKRFTGGYVLAVHRNLDGNYVLRELVLEEGRVLAENQLGGAEAWDVLQASLMSELVERFTP